MYMTKYVLMDVYDKVRACLISMTKYVLYKSPEEVSVVHLSPVESMDL